MSEDVYIDMLEDDYDDEPPCPTGGFWLKAPWQDHYQEVSKEEYLKAEAAAGFISKSGPGHPATSSFGYDGVRGQTWKPDKVK